jgi:uncharacterized delta-60 repeat protein
MHRLESRRLLAAGTLDPSFAGDGIATVPQFEPSIRSFDVAVQDDGKTVVVGMRGYVARFNFDGTPDSSFGDGGMTQTSFFVNSAVAIDTSGRIVVGGEGGDEGGEFGVARLMPDGSPDTSFGEDGEKTFGIRATIGVEGNSFLEDVALQNDGKIVAVGSNTNGFFSNNDDFAVARLNPNGSLDDSFDGDGKATIAFGREDVANAVAIDYSGNSASNPNYGKIVMVGSTGTDEFQKIAMARLNTDGTLDTSFGTGGRKTVTHGAYAAATGILIDPDGSYVISGDTAVSSTFHRDFFLWRSTPGITGSFFNDTDMGGNDRAGEVIRLAGGGYAVGGSSGLGASLTRLAVAVYDAAGELDTNFVNGGKIITNGTETGNSSFAFDGGLAVGPGRRFVLTGGKQFTTARYLDSGANLVVAGLIDPQASEEGPEPASFIVGRLEHLPVITRVYFSISGTATLGADYILDGMTVPEFGNPYVDIPAGASYTDVTLTPIDDSLAEGSERATFTIVPEASYEIGVPSEATIFIADNDVASFNTIDGRSIPPISPATLFGQLSDTDDVSIGVNIFDASDMN